MLCPDNNGRVTSSDTHEDMPAAIVADTSVVRLNQYPENVAKAYGAEYLLVPYYETDLFFWFGRRYRGRPPAPLPARPSGWGAWASGRSSIATGCRIPVGL